MPSDRHIVVHDRRRAPVAHGRDRAPAWEWSPDLVSDELQELQALRTERAELLERVDELHVAAQDAHDREERLRDLVRRLSTGPWTSRLATARAVRRAQVR